jgi:DNA-binding LacI/PurR family transcriptional regulator
MTQVAQMAEVTIGTVSHVINGTAPISAETRERVEYYIKELDYRPNIAAKSLQKKKNYSVGLMIPNLNKNFHSKIMSTFLDCAYEKGYSVQIHGYEYSLERERCELARLEDIDVGIVVIVNGYGDEPEIMSLVNKGIPVILADRSTDLPNVPFIKFDNRKVMMEMIETFKLKGYKRIGFFSEQLNLDNLQERFNSYQDALKLHGYEYNPNYVFIEEKLCLENLDNGYLYMKSLLEKRQKDELPDVWIASSDLLAVGMMHAITEKGYKIPDDMGIIGFDNIGITKHVRPKLSTVEQNQALLGERLMELVDQTYSGRKGEDSIVLEQKLILRESC